MMKIYLRPITNYHRIGRETKKQKVIVILVAILLFGVHTAQVAYAQNVGTPFDSISIACGTFSGPPGAVSNRVVVNSI